jgi:hypothetical protein
MQEINRFQRSWENPKRVDTSEIHFRARATWSSVFFPKFENTISKFQKDMKTFKTYIMMLLTHKISTQNHLYNGLNEMKKIRKSLED